MVCAETVGPDEQACFWRGCNHTYHQACLKLARAQGIEGCPRCEELVEAAMWHPQVVESEIQATQLEEQLQEDAEEEARLQADGKEETDSELSMGDNSSAVSMGDNSSAEAVPVDEAETQPAIFGSPKAGGGEAEATSVGGPTASCGGPKQGDADPKLNEDEVPLVRPAASFPDAQPPSTEALAPPKEQQPKEAEQLPKGPKSRKAAASKARSKAAASKAPAAAAPPTPATAAPGAAASSSGAPAAEAQPPPHTAAPGDAASSEALVVAEAPESSVVEAEQLVQCHFCLTLFRATSDDIKPSRKQEKKHKCKVCCKIDTVSSLSSIDLTALCDMRFLHKAA